MIEYIRRGIFRASFKFCMEYKLREEMGGGGGVKGMKRFPVHFNVQTFLQIFFWNNRTEELLNPYISMKEYEGGNN